MSKFKGIIKKTFIWEADKSGQGFDDGWVESHCPGTYFPAGPMTLAHDVFEHTLRPKAGIEEELKAFGAMIYTRVYGCYWREFRKERNCELYSFHVALELIEMLKRYDNKVKPAKPIKDRDEDAEPFIEDLHQYLVRQIPAGYFDDDLLEPYTLDEFTKVWPAVESNLWAGYQWAYNRYAPFLWGAEVTCLFKDLEEQVKRLGKCGAGERLFVTVDLKNCEVTTRLYYER